MPQVSFETWKEFIASQPNPHILQTAEWGELKRGFGWDVARILSGEVGAQILFRKLPLGFTVAYCPKPVFSNQTLRGWSSSALARIEASSRRAVTSNQYSAISKLEASPERSETKRRPEFNEGSKGDWQEQFWDEVDAVCKSRKAVFLKIEPDHWETENWPLDTGHWTLSPHNIQPPRTIVISLEGSEDEILGRMKQKCRYNVRLAEKKGVTIRSWDDLEGFHGMMTVTGGRDGFGVHSLEYYRKAYDLFYPAGIADILVAEYESKPLAALMVFALGKRAYYLYGASTDEERNRMPTYLLQWRAMQWAKERGCTEYDLWGVPDADEETLEAQFESRSDGLWGVYRFKRGFGGQVRRAAQALDRVYIRPLYWAYLKFMSSRMG
jgi:lipid II:glycine glycyltransferase (peptidoglycan interpeptide bridge formation enzyme)